MVLCEIKKIYIQRTYDLSDNDVYENKQNFTCMKMGLLSKIGIIALKENLLHIFYVLYYLVSTLNKSQRELKIAMK